jgi:hypothetical protein
MDVVMIKNTKNQKEDDMVRVRLNLDLNEFEITLHDQNNGDKVSHRLEVASKDKILNYLYLLLKSFSLDEDGYENIQVNVPLMPRVLFSVASIKEVYVREHVHDLLRMGLDNLEDVERLPSKTPVNPPNPDNLAATVADFYATPPRSAYASSAAVPPPAPRRSARISRIDQQMIETNNQNDRYFSHLINNQRHGFFDHDA